MSPVGTNINKAHKGDLLYNEWLFHRNMIVDVNSIRELLDVRENYKSIYKCSYYVWCRFYDWKYVYKLNNV